MRSAFVRTRSCLPAPSITADISRGKASSVGATSGALHCLVRAALTAIDWRSCMKSFVKGTRVMCREVRAIVVSVSGAKAIIRWQELDKDQQIEEVDVIDLKPTCLNYDVRCAIM